MNRGNGQLGAIRSVLDRADRSTEIPVVFCFDVEPDPRVYDRSSPPPWAGFERCAEGIQARRERLSEVAGRPVVFTWFLRLDPQIEQTWGSPTWVAERYGHVLAELTEAGDQLGLHTHAWRWNAQSGTWFNDLQDPAWSERCLSMGLDAFETAFGRKCETHRGGDRFLNAEMLDVMEKRGVKIDLTVEPGLPPLHAEQGEGWSPDYRRAPTRPYHASPESFPAADPTRHSGPLFVPLLSTPRRRPPFRGEPLFPWRPSKRFRQRLAVALFRKPAPVAAFAVRTHMSLDTQGWNNVTANLERLAEHRQMVFKTASETA